LEEYIPYTITTLAHLHTHVSLARVAAKDESETTFAIYVDVVKGSVTDKYAMFAGTVTKLTTSGIVQ